MNPETQDIYHEMISFSHIWEWNLTLLVYDKELESEDLWSCFDMRVMREIFINTMDEAHRMRACDFIIRNQMPADEMIDLLTDYFGLAESDAGMQMLVYLSCILCKIEIFDLQRLFHYLFDPCDKKFMIFYTKIAKEIAIREKPKPPSID